jgi:hypothetical protein
MADAAWDVVEGGDRELDWRTRRELRRRWRFSFLVVVEGFGDKLASAFGDVSGAFGGANADILGPDAHPFADVFDGTDGMKRDEVAGTLADAFGCFAGSFGRPLADIA